jgi:uncharacterized protein (TIGR00251 family)
MPARKYRLHHGKGGAAIAVRVVPRAGRSAIAEVMSDGTVRIQLKAAPINGEANRELVQFLAGVLRVAKTRVEVVGGLTGRQKLVSILGLDAESVHRRIAAHLK